MEELAFYVVSGRVSVGDVEVEEGVMLVACPNREIVVQSTTGARVMVVARMRLAGRDEGGVYDRLLQVQADLTRGEAGIEKPLSCSASQLAKVAKLATADEQGLERILGERRATLPARGGIGPASTRGQPISSLGS